MLLFSFIRLLTVLKAMDTEFHLWVAVEDEQVIISQLLIIPAGLRKMKTRGTDFRPSGCVWVNW
jgi:hypothetical protein